MATRAVGEIVTPNTALRLALTSSEAETIVISSMQTGTSLELPIGDIELLIGALTDLAARKAAGSAEGGEDLHALTMPEFDLGVLTSEELHRMDNLVATERAERQHYEGHA